jgi:hypothetical protein
MHACLRPLLSNGPSQQVNSEDACLQPLPCNTTMEATSVFFAVRSGNDVIRTVGESERCFLCGLLTGYIVQSQRQPAVTSPAVKKLVKWLVFDSGAAAVCNGKGPHKSWLQQWLQSWSCSLQSKRVDSIVVSYKVYTL